MNALFYALTILTAYLHVQPIELPDVSCSLPPLAGEQCVELLAQLYVALNTLSNIRGSGDVFSNDVIHQLARYNYRIELESELEPSRGATG